MKDTLFSFQKKYIQSINHQIINNRIILINGQSGVGKTYICDKFLEFRNDCYAVKCNFSNLSFSDTNHIELKVALYTSLSSMKKGVDFRQISKEISTASKDLPILNNVTARIFEALFNKRLDKLQNNTLKIFSDDEIEIINLFCRITNKNRLILILDNIHWANNSTLMFLYNLIKISTNICLFKNPLYIIFISTIKEGENSDYNKNFLNFPLYSIHIDDIDIENYREVIKHFHPNTSFSDKTIQFLYSITRGHLELNKNLLKNICNQEVEEIIENYKGDSKQKICEIFLSLFDNITLQYLTNKKETTTTLEVASIIGNIFNKYELSKLLNMKIALLEEYIQDACNNMLTINEAEIAKFTHPIIQELFLQKLNKEQYEWHIKYAKCLKVIRPTRLILRGLHYEAGGEELEALLSYVLSYFECLRKKNKFPDTIYNFILCKKEYYKIDRCFKHICEAIMSFVSLNPQEGIDNLGAIDNLDIFYPVLQHYKDLLYARCLLETVYDTNKIKEIVKILRNAQEYFLEHQEIELAVHCILLLINLYADKLNSIQQAKELEKIFFNIYNQYVCDTEMLRYYYEYKRTSLTLCSPEIGIKRLEDCIYYHKKEHLKDPVEYYKCICNYSGLLIFMGDYEKAINEIEKNEVFLVDQILFNFPEPHKLLNNYILSKYLKSLSTENKFQLSYAIDDYEKLCLIKKNKIISINLANLYILNNQLEKAEEILYWLKKDIETVNKDVFYHLHVYSNLCSLFYIKQEYQMAQKYLNLAYIRIDEFSPNIRSFYTARKKFFDQLLNEHPILSANELLFYFINKNSNILGKSWKFVGLGFLFSDLQFYTS